MTALQGLRHCTESFARLVRCPASVRWSHSILQAILMCALMTWRWPMCRQQDEDLDQLGESVQRIGHLGLTIHEELQQQVSTHERLFASTRALPTFHISAGLDDTQLLVELGG